MAEAHQETITAHDFADHASTYEGFLRFAAIGTAWTLGIVVVLAIGGTTGRWGLGSVLLLLSTIATIFGLAVKSWSWKPAAAVLLLELLALLVLSH